MATSSIKYLHPLRTNARHIRSGNSIITDAPVDNEGKGEFFSPTDLTATSLASCMMTVMGIYSNQNNLDLGEVSCEVVKEMTTQPRRISRIIINMTWKTNLLEEEIQNLKKVALNCPVANSLHPDIEQLVNFIII